MEELKLNYPSEKYSEIASKQVFQYLISSNYCINKVIPKEVLQKDKDYLITGGSARDGAPMCKFISTRVKRIKILNLKRHKKVKVVSKFVDHTTSALNLVAVPETQIRQ